MDDCGPDSKGGHQHKRHRPVRYHVEGGGGADQHLPLLQHVDARRPPGSRYGRGTGMSIMELELDQELVRIYQDPLFLVLMDLRKA